jgi:DNA polymerase elongation subunit (family B)
MKSPKLRNVEKYIPPYPINQFPKNFAIFLGKVIENLPEERLAIKNRHPNLLVMSY